MKALAALLAGVTAFAASASARTVRVGIWWQHPPAQVHLRSLPAAQWRRCPTCVSHPLKSLEIAADATTMKLGNTSVQKLYLSGDYELSVNDTATHLAWPAEIHAHAGRLSIVVSMPLEEYVAGVLAGEAGGVRSDAALDAFAIAARTYAVRFQHTHVTEGFDLCDTTHCQNLRLSGVSQRVRDAVARTDGELLWYHGEPAATYYHRSCGGELEDGSLLIHPAAPYLRAHPDEYCIRRGHDEWRGEVAKRDLSAALQREGLRVPAEIRSAVVTDRTPGGRAKSIRLIGDTSAVIPASRFRLAVGREFGWQVIRSDAYDVTDAGDRIVFFGRGQGHGVGLCQTGAMVMALEGKSAREILAYYFPGTQLGVSAQGFEWTSLADESLELQTTDPNRDKEFAAEASRALRDMEQRTSWHPGERPILHVYPTVAAFRDSTGEPGWVAASTRGRVIRLQPASILKSKGILDSTLRHEFAHILIEEHASRQTPLWMREGLASYLAEGTSSGGPTAQYSEAQLETIFRNPKSERELRNAYREARQRIAALVERQGEANVLKLVK